VEDECRAVFEDKFETEVDNTGGSARLWTVCNH